MNIFHFLKNKHHAKKVLSDFKSEIACGFYVFFEKNKKIELLKESKNKEPFFKKMFRIFYIKGTGKHTSFAYNEGTEKTLLICNDFVIAKFKNGSVNHVLDVAQRLKLYCDYLPIQCCKYYEFNFDKRIFKMEKIDGTSFLDSRHALELADLFLRNGLSKENKYVIHNNCGIAYIQHGDPGLNNVIYRNGNEPVFIDNDNLGFYPALYDCFVLITYMDDSFSLLKKFYSQNLEKLKLKFASFGITFSDSAFDYYLSLFVYFRFLAYDDETRFREHRCFSFLKNEQSKDVYPITSMIYNKLINKNCLPEYDAFFNFLHLIQESDKKTINSICESKMSIIDFSNI